MGWPCFLFTFSGYAERKVVNFYAMDHFSDPHDSGSQGHPPTSPRKIAFQQHMKPLWDEVLTRLAADRPPDWQGYRCEVTAQHDRIRRHFSLKCDFRDQSSNRKRLGPPQQVTQLLSDLFLHYVEFAETPEWKKVIFEQIWNPEKKSWGYEIKWEYDYTTGR